jgi:hypothetical protein
VGLAIVDEFFCKLLHAGVLRVRARVRSGGFT